MVLPRDVQRYILQCAAVGYPKHWCDCRSRAHRTRSRTRILVAIAHDLLLPLSLLLQAAAGYPRSDPTTANMSTYFPFMTSPSPRFVYLDRLVSTSTSNHSSVWMPIESETRPVVSADFAIVNSLWITHIPFLAGATVNHTVDISDENQNVPGLFRFQRLQQTHDR